MTKIIYARIEEVATECFIVVAALGNGRFAYHNGPVDYAYFSKDQAEEVCLKVNAAKCINLNHWNDGSFCDMTIRDMEDEYYNQNA